MLGFLFGKVPQGLRVKVVKKPCGFILYLHYPMDTLKRLVMFFEERRVIVDKLQLNRYRNGEAMLTIQCMIEKDMIESITNELKEFPGVKEMDRLGTNATDKV